MSTSLLAIITEFSVVFFCLFQANDAILPSKFSDTNSSPFQRISISVDAVATASLNNPKIMQSFW